MDRCPVGSIKKGGDIMVGFDIKKKDKKLLNMIQVSVVIIIIDLAAFSLGCWLLFGGG